MGGNCGANMTSPSMGASGVGPMPQMTSQSSVSSSANQSQGYQMMGAGGRENLFAVNRFAIIISTNLYYL